MAKEKSKSKAEAPVDLISESLAVKYRPRKFKDLVGQPHVVSVVKGMFTTGKFPGAILIEGQTGGGKTTTARMLHAYINCEKRSACGECPSCTMGVETHPDLQVINAGENGGVDNIRKLIKGSRQSPMFNKRVIIIDEAHKLTGASLEAMLIPLEEPSRDTIWILCTTEPEALKDTLKSRCTRLVMKPIGKVDAVARLAAIAKKEGTDVEKVKGGKEALEMIADFTNGSMREAIAILETVLFGVAGGGDISDKNVLSAYVQNSEVDLDKAAAQLVFFMANDKFKEAVGVIRSTQNLRGLLSKTLWLIDFLIADVTKTAKFVPYTGRLFKEYCKKNKVEGAKFSKLLTLMRVFVDANQDFNKTSVGESFILHATIEKYARE